VTVATAQAVAVSTEKDSSVEEQREQEEAEQEWEETKSSGDGFPPSRQAAASRCWKFQVVGEAYVHGLEDATGVCGPLPSPRGGPWPTTASLCGSDDIRGNGRRSAT